MNDLNWKTKDSQLPILIVDDSHQYSHVLQVMLKQYFGYQNITVLDNTSEARHILESPECAFEMFFIDFHFPDGTTGGTLLEDLGSRGILERRLAFLITSEPTPEKIKMAIEAGAVGVIAKPFDRAELQRQLVKAERHLEVRRGEQF